MRQRCGEAGDGPASPRAHGRMLQAIIAVVFTLWAGVACAQQPVGAAAPATPDQLLSGQQIFATTCGFCHQAGGRAAGRGPKLAGIDRTDEYIRNRIRVGKEGAMPAYGRAFTEAEIGALIAYIRSLKDDDR